MKKYQLAIYILTNLMTLHNNDGPLNTHSLKTSVYVHESVPDPSSDVM